MYLFYLINTIVAHSRQCHKFGWVKFIIQKLHSHIRFLQIYLSIHYKPHCNIDCFKMIWILYFRCYLIILGWFQVFIDICLFDVFIFKNIPVALIYLHIMISSTCFLNNCWNLFKKSILEMISFIATGTTIPIS